MTRRNFFNFVAGFFAGSLLPWPRRRRQNEQQWTLVQGSIFDFQRRHGKVPRTPRQQYMYMQYLAEIARLTDA